MPAIEVVSMARKTESWPLFVQQFGRALRLMIEPSIAANWDSFTGEERRAHIATSAKPFALIIDHVGNVIRHGVPDAYRLDTLDAGERRSSGASDAIPTRICTNTNVGGDGTVCAKTYERFHKTCPYCGFYPEPPVRTAPEFVDGDLFELDPATLAAMRGRVAQVDGAPNISPYQSEIVQFSVRKQHQLRQTAQHFLREQIALWAGWQKTRGYDDSQSYRIFYLTMGVDVVSAQALGRTEAEALSLRIKQVLDNHGVISI